MIAASIDAALRAAGTPERAEQERRYLKSELEHYGVTVPAIRRAVKEELATQPDLGREQLVAAVEELWAEPVHERRMAAVELLDLRGDLLEAPDLALVERPDP